MLQQERGPVLPLDGRVDARHVLGAARDAAALRPTSPSSTRTSTIAAGRSRAPRSTSRCGRRGARSETPSAAPRGPLTFVVSGGLGEPPTTERLRAFLALYPTLRFKLDATADWTDAI